MSTLAMLSGGLDSTAMLVRLLAQSQDELRVHHIRLVNREGRAEAEERAVRGIVAYCTRHYRPFRYTESALDFSALEAIPIDYLAVAYVACQVAIDTPGCSRIAVGTLATDTDEINRSRRQREVFGVMYECYRARRLGEAHVEWTYPVHALDKAALARLLAPELLALTWSCRRPLRSAAGFEPCGTCKACRARANMALAPQGGTERQSALSPARQGNPE
jgi:7-cyano-7-deazaguanine synthase in queuosine biosynthesis